MKTLFFIFAFVLLAVVQPRGVEAADLTPVWSRDAVTSLACGVPACWGLIPNVRGVAVDSAGAYYIGRYNDGVNSSDRYQKRDPLSGIAVWTQDEPIDPMAPASHGPTAVAVFEGYLYVVSGLEDTNGDYLWRIEKRDTNAAGPALWTKDINLVQASAAYDLRVDSTGVYVTGPYICSGQWCWNTSKVSLDGTTLLWSDVSYQSAGSYPHAIELQGSDLYVVGAASGQASIRKLDKTTGVSTGDWVDPYFENLWDVTTDASGIYLGGYAVIATGPLDTEWRVKKVDLSFNEVWSYSDNLTLPVSGDISLDVVTNLALDSNNGLYVYGMSGNASKWGVRGKKLNALTGVLSGTDEINPPYTDAPIVGIGRLLDMQATDSGVYIVYNNLNDGWHMDMYALVDGCGTVKDTRDGNTYDTITVGTQCWMRENMNIGTRINAGTDQHNDSTIEKYCYNNQVLNCNNPHPTYPDGGLYQWNEAMQYSVTEGAQGICPDGWHIPTDAEWYTLEYYLKSTGQSCSGMRDTVFECSTAGSKLKPGGSSRFEGNLTGGIYGGSSLRNNYVQYWSSTAYGSSTWNRRIGTGHPGVWRGLSPRLTYGHPVRCVQNSTAVVGTSDPNGLATTPGACGTGLIGVTWDSVAGATSYDIQIDGGAWQNLGDVTTYTHSGLVPDSSHTYSVRSRDPNGPGAATDPESETAPSACVACAAGVSLSWTDVTGTMSCEGVTTGPWNVGDDITISDTLTSNDGVANFVCGAGGNWDSSPVTANCSLPLPPPPNFAIVIDPKLLRNGDTTGMSVTTTAPNQLSCDIYGATASPLIDVVVPPNGSYTVATTKPIYNKQLVGVECTDTDTGGVGSAEATIEVLPTIQEI